MREAGRLNTRPRQLGWSLALGLACATTVLQASSGAEEAGLTGATRPGDVVQARQLLMEAIEAEMMPIDVAVGGREMPLKSLQDHAYLINTLMAAFPHLFPPKTGPDAKQDDWPAPTNALPAVWAQFDAFYDLSQKAAAQALAASQAGDLAALKAAGKDLRGSCDACHATYMKQ